MTGKRTVWLNRIEHNVPADLTTYYFSYQDLLGGSHGDFLELHSEPSESTPKILAILAGFNKENGHGN